MENETNLFRVLFRSLFFTVLFRSHISLCYFCIFFLNKPIVAVYGIRKYANCQRIYSRPLSAGGD